MQAYFSFLRQAGKGLDPRTRALISVLTKVMSQTETGLRRYLPKALDAGVSAGEVLDALLMAFPALGLTRVVWAIEIIQDMALPEFDLEALASPSEWQLLGPADQFRDRVTASRYRDRLVWVVADGERFEVFDSRCPHQGTYITDSQREGYRVTCPKHRWAFDLRDGRCVGEGDRPLVRLEHTLREGALWVR
jgi:nitrite reductase/ring-hydroxylating ferredoxin subunit